jgi:hypothetical protein
MGVAVSLPDRYEILRELGRGGMGAVYEAVDRETGGRVAIKALESTDADLLALFKREYRELHDISHPNLVTLGELFCEQGLWAYSMELVDGTDFLAYVRGSDERLRGALVQLAEGLGALHAAHRIHRDVKPSNILVRKDGHLFLLDFGLVVGIDPEDDITRAGTAGTPSYMAPEQVLGEPLGPEADLYSVGVMLFEALTRQKPFPGRGTDVMTAKVEREAPEPRELAPDVPADLNALATRLLARDPKLRPPASEVVRVLKRRVAIDPLPAGHGQTSTISNEVRRLFGRDAELAILDGAFRSTLEGLPACVLVEGESGIGKSLLVQRFVGRLRQEDARVVVLSGRCYEKESVPYKAFDSVIDALVRRMHRMPKMDAALLMPTQLGPLVQTFPIFRRVDIVAQQTRSARSRMDPLETRSRAFTALREIFERMALRAPLIVTIDDMQWSDQDSMGLLAELVREPSPPPFLLLLTARPSSEVHEAGAEFREVLPPRTTTLPLARLSESAATELARWLLGRHAPERVADAAAIAREAEGHALFIERLAHHVGTDSAVGEAKLRLEDVLETSIKALEPDTRRLLLLLCVAGTPVPVVALAHAAGLAPGAIASIVATLRVHRFIQTVSTEGVASVEPYHGRVRAAALACQTAEELASAHERLARALEGTSHGAPHVLAELWRGAGDLERCGEHALKAAEHSAGAFAFDRAATFYEWALERPSATEAEKHDIRVALGMTLSKAGRGAQAAAAYMAAAETASGMEEQLDLECRSAEQLLRVGEFDAGILAVRRVLARVGLSWPRTPLTTVLTFIGLRIWRVLRGYKPAAPRPRARSARETLRLNVCWAVTSGLGMCDNLRAAVFQQRYLDLALRSGDARRISIALSADCAFHARGGEAAWPSTARGIEHALSAAKATGDPYCIGFSDVMAGGAQYLSGRLRAAAESMDRGQDRLRSECPGTTFEIVTGQVWLLTCLYWLGEWRTLLERQPVYLREASDRGDVYGTVHMSVGYGNFAWLLLDDAKTGRVRARDAMKRWSRGLYRMEQWYALLAESNVELYAGDGAVALRRVDEDWAQLEASLLPQRIEVVRVAGNFLRARALIAAAEKEGKAGAHLGEAERLARRMRRSRSRLERAAATSIGAAAAHVRGDEDGARAGLRASVDAFEALETRMLAAMARRYLGKLVKGDEGAEMVRAAEQAMKEQAVRNVAAMARCLVPGFGRLD